MSFTAKVFVTLSLGATLGLSAQPLKFDLIDQQRIVVRGAVGPLEGLKLLIDTGAIPSVVDRKVAKKLALSLSESEFVAFGKTTRVQTTVLPSIRLGPLHAEGLPAGVGDLSFLHGVDAIVGLDVLSRSSFKIDYKERLLEFGPMPARTPSVKLDATPPFLTVQLVIAGQSYRFLVDTGSGRLVLFDRRVRDRLPFLSVHGELVFNHLSGTSRVRRVFLPTINAGDTSIAHMEGFLSDQSVDAYPPEIDGVLGMRALSPKRVDFDFERNRLAFH